MRKFRKKPVVVEAIQFLPFQDDRNKPQSNVPCVFMDIENSETMWSIKTLEGRYNVTPNDWIIKGIEGEFYPCKPEIFKKTYDEVFEDKLDKIIEEGKAKIKIFKEKLKKTAEEIDKIEKEFLSKTN